VKRALWLLWLVACRTPPFPVEDAAPDAGSLATTNACGGSASLDNPPGVACGQCGLIACDGTDSTRCDEVGKNACGDCGPLPAEVCNGRDDNCDGRVDEGCAQPVGPSLAGNATRVRVSGDHLIVDLNDNRSWQIVDVTLSTGATQILNPMPRNGVVSHGTIDGTLVSWRTGAGAAAYDLATQTFYPTLEYSHEDSLYPGVNAGRITFEVSSGTPNVMKIELWELATKSVRTVYTGPGLIAHTVLSGDWLVFHRYLGHYQSAEIVAYHLVTNEQLTLSAGVGGFNMEPAIDGNTVVWHREDVPQLNEGQPYQSPPNGDIYVYDLVARSRRLVTHSAAGFNQPRISGSLLLWTGDGYHLTVADLLTGKQKEIAPNGWAGDIEGRSVYWIDRHVQSQLLGRDLLSNEP